MPDTLRLVIVEDEPLVQFALQGILDELTDVEIVGVARDGQAGLELIRAVRPHVALLDINLPGMNGLELAQVLAAETGTVVIFITGSDAFALPAFGLAADYLVKPAEPERLRLALARARRRLSEASAAGRASELQNVVDAMRAEAGLAAVGVAIWVTGPRGRHRQPVAGIDWFEAQRDYVVIHAGERHFTQRGTLRDLMGKLDEALFVRVHRSAIVNLAAVTGIERRNRGQYLARLATGAEIPIGRVYLPGLRASVERAGVVQVRG